MKRVALAVVVALATSVGASFGNVAFGQASADTTATSGITQTWTLRKGSPGYSQTLAFLRSHAGRGDIKYVIEALAPADLGDAFKIRCTRVHKGPGMIAPLDVPAPFPPPLPRDGAGAGSTCVVSSGTRASHVEQGWTWEFLPDTVTGGYAWALIDYHACYSPACLKAAPSHPERTH